MDQKYAEQKREQMVKDQIESRGIRNQRLLAALKKVPRHTFVGPEYEELAYEDGPLPTEEGQTISQPYIVALMLELARLKPTDKVLEIGTGSGFSTCILAEIVNEVFTIEAISPLAEKAAKRFKHLGYKNIHAKTGDGSLGWSEHSPFDAIIVTAGAPEAPEPLKNQLRIGGRMVIPIGDQRTQQTLIVVERVNQETYKQTSEGSVLFVPLVGKQGWRQ